MADKTKAGHDYFSSEKPEEILAAEEKRKQATYGKVDL